jgi:penicillin-binding protein A
VVRTSTVVSTPKVRSIHSQPDGTAYGIFSPALDVAVKTGTAQTGNAAGNTDDWMIGFAPANNPKIAVAVVLPLQPFAGTGAAYAGSIMKAMLDAAALLPSG